MRGRIDPVPRAARELSARRRGADARVVAALLRVPGRAAAGAGRRAAGRDAGRARHAGTGEAGGIWSWGQVILLYSSFVDGSWDIGMCN